MQFEVHWLTLCCIALRLLRFELLCIVLLRVEKASQVLSWAPPFSPPLQLRQDKSPWPGNTLQNRRSQLVQHRAEANNFMRNDLVWVRTCVLQKRSRERRLHPEELRTGLVVQTPQRLANGEILQTYVFHELGSM